MSIYKSMMLGHNKKKKKVTKKNIELKEQKNIVLDNIKKDLNEWKMFPTSNSPTPFKKPLQEVGMAPELKAYTSKIEQDYKKYWDSVKELEKFLMKKGLKKPAKEIHRQYMKLVTRFNQNLKIMIKKLI